LAWIVLANFPTIEGIFSMAVLASPELRSVHDG
jgi:hypothetical protein